MRLHTYQQRGVRHVLRWRRCALWWEMGLGKTLTVLVAVRYLMSRFEVYKVLVVAPLRVAKDTWPAEIEKWFPELRYSVIAGSRDKRIAALQRDARIYITNYENLPWLVDTVGDAWEYDMVVLDEATRLKRPSGKRRRALLRVRNRIDRMVQLAGLAAPNGIQDLWGPLHLLDGGKRLGRTVTVFRDRYMSLVDRETFRYTPKAGAVERITRLVKDICMSLEAKDYLSMPPLLENTVRVPLPPAARAQYAELHEEYVLLLKDAEITAANTGALFNKLLQFTAGALYDEHGDWHVVHDAKLEALESVLEEAGGPVLVAYNFRSDAARLLARFPQAEMFDDTSTVRWNRGEIQVLLIHPRSAAHGLNLQWGGNVICWYSLTWSLDEVRQLNARLHRQGQERPVYVHYLEVPNSIDGYVRRAVQDKASVQQLVTELTK